MANLPLIGGPLLGPSLIMSQDHAADPEAAEGADEDLFKDFDDCETLPCSCSYVSWVALSDVFLLIHYNGESSWNVLFFFWSTVSNF